MNPPDVLAAFPKTRPPLSPALRAIYTRQYLENRAGGTVASSMAQRLERWMHRQVAADRRAGAPGPTLELGGGTLNQLAFEPACADYDVVEPFAELYAGSPYRDRVRDIFATIDEIPAERRYRRLTAVAALEHICDLPLVLALAVRRLAPGGELRAAIPSEGGVLWRVGWRLTTGLEFRLRHGLDYGQLMAHEHVNDAREMERLVRLLFAEVQIRSFGLGLHLSLYRFIRARKPRPGVAEAWIDRFA